MLNVLVKKRASSRPRAWWPKVMLLSVALIFGIGQAQAQSVSCKRNRDLTPMGSWKMAPNGTVFKNGDLVGKIGASIEFDMPISHGDTAGIIAGGATTTNNYQAVPLTGMPGLGLVVRWGNQYTTTSLTMLAPPLATGTIISSQPWISVLQARARVSYTMVQIYEFELVVIDETIYKGGKLTFTDQGQVFSATSLAKGNATPQLCMGGWLDLMGALTGSVQVPELPKPALPSCKFSTSTLAQSVTLGPVDPGQIPAASSLRPSGEAGQNHFLIEGTGCTKDTKLSFYFTDTRDTATTKSYLLTSNPAVGIRLFHRGEYEPVPFGPPPSGSWVPPRYAPSVGPAEANGATLSTGFTAQYVRLPNKTEADIRPGPLQGAATFVIVYP